MTLQMNIADTALQLQKIEAYLSSDPSNLELLSTAIEMNLAAGKFDQARKHAEAAIKLYPTDIFFRNQLGNVLIAQDALVDAERIFSGLNLEVSDINVVNNLAWVYFKQKKFEAACALLMPYVDTPAMTTNAVILLVRCLHHDKMIKDAIEVVKKYTQICADNFEFLSVASLLYFDNEQMAEAKKFSEAALLGNVNSIEALVTSGSIELGMGNIGAARTRFEAALNLNKVDGRSWSGLGMTSLLAQDFLSANEQLQRATQYMPTHIGTWHTLAWCKIVCQDLDGAGFCFQQALELDRNFGETHGGIAVVAAMQGKQYSAEESIKRALKLDPTGLSAKYAQMVLSGDVKNLEKFKEMSMKILATREGPNGGNMAEIVKKWIKQN